MLSSTTRRFTVVSALALLMAFICFEFSRSEDRSDPAAEQILQKMSKFYQELENFSVDVTYSVGSDDDPSEVESRHVAVARPGQFVVKSGAAVVISDGKQLLTHVPAMNSYSLEVAGDIESALQQESVLFMGTGRIALQLATSDPFSQFMESVTDLSLLDAEQVEGVKCHRVEATEEESTTILWIEAGDRPLLRKMEWVIAYEQAEDDEGAEPPKPTISFKNWSIDTDLPVDTFAISPPADAEQVNSLLMFGTVDTDEPHALLGMEAPDSELVMLDGQQYTVAGHEGEKVVVLDFWATWCGPCVEALPSLAKVAEEFSDRDVAFYAVNIGEEEADIRAFLDEKQLNVPVVLDADGSISDRFDATSIPQTVVIDKQGRVQVVHAGLSSDYEQILAEELEAVLDGQNLADEALEAAREAKRLGDEIPTDDDARTYRDYNADMLAFNLRTMLEAYEQFGSHDPEWDEEAKAFLTETARHFATAEGYKSQADLVAMGKPLIDNGCDDPLVWYCYGAMLQDANVDEESNAEAIRLVENSYTGLVERGYPQNRQFAAAKRIWRTARQANSNSGKCHEFGKLTRDHAAAMILQDELGNDQGRILASHLFGFANDLPLEGKRELYDAAKEHEDEQPWLVNYIGGMYHKDAAWASRGTGWASEVTDEGWDGFSDHIEKAEECFQKAWEAAPSRPEVPTEMVALAMTRGTLREMRKWFDRAVAAQLDYRPAYHNMLYGMMPRWQADHETMYQFGMECVATERYDTDVPYMLCEALWRIAKDDHNPLGTRYWQKPGIYEDVQTVCQRYISRQPEPNSYSDWWQTVSLGFAYSTEHWDDAVEILDEIEDKLDWDALGRFPLNRDKVVSAVRMRTGPHAEEILDALSLADDGNHEEAIERLTALSEKDEIYPLVQEQLRSQLQGLQWREQFENGESIEFVPNEKLVGWKVVSGTWNVDSDGSLKGTSDNGGVILQCLGDFGSNWELSGEFEYGKSPYSPWYAGVLFYGTDEKPSYAVMLHPTQQWVAAGPFQDLDEYQIPHVQRNKVVSFVIRMEDGVVDVWIDDAHVIEEQVFAGWTARQPICLAIGAKYRWYGSELTYRNLSIKSLE